MKTYLKLLFITMVAVFTFSCSKNNADPNNNNPSNPTNEYASYDFYLADRGCSIVDEFTKNFKPISGYDNAVNFNVIGNNLYTFGAKKYRNNPESGCYTKTDNYSGFLSKNGTEIYTNIGGNSSSVIGVREIGADLYFVTGFKSQEGVVSESTVQCTPKVYKNGILMYTLSGTFNFPICNGSGNTSKSLGIEITGILVNGNDVIVYGSCYDYNSDIISYGYWKNGVYFELKRIPVFFGYYSKAVISESGDIYYLFGKDQTNGRVFLYKNNSDILNNNVTINNVGIKDFGILNNDIYILGRYYDNGYYIGIYKNGVLDYSFYAGDLDDYKMDVVDNKIFISGYRINGDYKMSVFEYKLSTKKIVKVGDTGKDYQTCGAVNILNFQVIKK
jgi:hypothetical protein